VIDEKEQFPIIGFGSEAFTKFLIEMLLYPVTKIIATARIKPI
jgi:hypothetical protein